LPSRLSQARLAALEIGLPEGRWFTLDEALRLGLPAPVRKLLVSD
jgi:A/G-specific adenine glycosylase